MHHPTHQFALRAIAFEGLPRSAQVALVTRRIHHRRPLDILRLLERFALVTSVEAAGATPEAILSNLTPLGAEVRGVILDSILTSRTGHWMLERPEWEAWANEP